MKSCVIVGVSAIALVSGAAQAQVSVNGVIGGEWAVPGVTTVHVTRDAGVGSNTTSESIAYDTYFRGDGTYAYFGLKTDASTGGTAIGNFANLYFANTAPSAGGSTIGMEVTNNRFFTPVNTPNPALSNKPLSAGGPDGYYYAEYANGGLGLAPQYQWSFVSNPAGGVVELAIPYAFFTDDPLSMGFGASTHIWFRSSQSFGYNFIFGNNVNSNVIEGNDERFGLITIPAPASTALLGLGGLVVARRRRQA